MALLRFFFSAFLLFVLPIFSVLNYLEDKFLMSGFFLICFVFVLFDLTKFVIKFTIKTSVDSLDQNSVLDHNAAIDFTKE